MKHLETYMVCFIAQADSSFWLEHTRLALFLCSLSPHERRFVLLCNTTDGEMSACANFINGEMSGICPDPLLQPSHQEELRPLAWFDHLHHSLYCSYARHKLWHMCAIEGRWDSRTTMPLGRLWLHFCGKARHGKKKSLEFQGKHGQ